MSVAKENMRGKNVLLGVTGGIAAYKALDVIGRLRDAGAEVRVVMTRGAMNFVTPLSFQARSGAPVYTDMWEPAQANQIEHIEYARWADLLLVAPASAHTLAKFARGLADDPLSTLYLAFDGPVLVAPAMNRAMWDHPATRRNVEILEGRGVGFIAPATGKLACGEEGVGKMAEVETVVAAALDALSGAGDMKGRRVLVTAGPTREAIDPVRFISNPSSGKMGYALAAEAARRGAKVTLVSGPVSLAPPPDVEVVPVETAEEMWRAVSKAAASADMQIFCAAVGDYRPKQSRSSKIKKTGRAMTLELAPTKDIAFETSKKAKPGQLRVGFAAETDDLEKNAKAKLLKKKLDFIVGNDVSDKRYGFGSDENHVVVFDRAGNKTDLPPASKPALARSLMDLFIRAWEEK